MSRAIRIHRQPAGTRKVVQLPAHERAAQRRREDVLRLRGVPVHRARPKASKTATPARKTWDVRGIGFPPRRSQVQA